MALKSDIKRLEYAKEYYQRNKEKIKARRRERWAEANEEQRAKHREECKRSYAKNPEKSKNRTLQWFKENRELVNARVRMYRYKKEGKTDLVLREQALIEQIKLKKSQNKSIIES